MSLTVTAGAEITLDYATLYNESMPDFDCHCGDANCRGTIRGSDFMAEFVDRYGEHISDYVRNRRNGRVRSSSE